MQSRDRGCRFPGCTNKRFTDAHHIEHWANGGETSRDNLVLLCSVHHRLVHEEGFTIERTPKGLLFRTPRGRLVEDAPRTAVLMHDPVLALIPQARAAAGSMLLRSPSVSSPSAYLANDARWRLSRSSCPDHRGTR